MKSNHNLVRSQPPQAHGVSSPSCGRVGGNAPLVVQIYALGRGVTVEAQRSNLADRQGAFELEARGKFFVFSPFWARYAYGFVKPVKRKVSPIFLSLQAVDQAHMAEIVGSGFQGESPFKTVILSLPAGYGKTTMASELLQRLGCDGVVDEWCPKKALTPRHLHLTNVPLE